MKENLLVRYKGDWNIILKYLKVISVLLILNEFLCMED